VADDVVLRAQQLLLAVAGKLDKDLVAVSDATFQIGFGNDEIIIAHHTLLAGGNNGFVFHANTLTDQRLENRRGSTDRHGRRHQ
jgi:hypothetical protein